MAAPSTETVSPLQTLLDSGTPFVLLDDARVGAGPAVLLSRPAETVVAHAPDEVRLALQRVKRAVASGRHAAGFLAYEAGHALEPRLEALCRPAAADAPPLLWFGVFDQAEDICTERLADPEGAWASEPRPLVSEDEHGRAVRAAKAHIEAGDIYQANVTFPAEVALAGSPIALYAALRARAAAGHGGIVHTGAHILLSWSPELFFTIRGGRITARPMKGTEARGPTPDEDAAAARALAEDPKQLAENLMIVDLIRNDLSRLASAGSVEVPALFDVETYPTLHQMTSTVTALLEEGKDAIDLIEATFPCGSVTGAPKIRAMEIIAELEPHPRGVYTGSIGRVAPDGEAAFNVAIRTLVLRRGESRGIMGLGSGIVADSDAAAEWRECLAKGKFVAGPSFDLFETMRFDPHDGLVELERHLARMKESAEALGFAFDRHHARNELQAATFRLREPMMVRLRLSPRGAMAIETRAIPTLPQGPVPVAVAPLPVAREDFRLRHKTSDRGFYEDARAVSGSFEVVFADQDGFLTEGSFTNLFVKRGGRLLTPPLARGLLPGVLRSRLIEEGKAEEAEIRTEDLANGFFIGNAVRGLIQARLR